MINHLLTCNGAYSSPLMLRKGPPSLTWPRTLNPNPVSFLTMATTLGPKCWSLFVLFIERQSWLVARCWLNNWYNLIIMMRMMIKCDSLSLPPTRIQWWWCCCCVVMWCDDGVSLFSLQVINILLSFPPRFTAPAMKN